MFRFTNKKKFLKSLQPGQIVRHQGLISNIVILFEFGHYDEIKDKVYWQTARVQLGRQPEDDALTNTASVQFDRNVFEQVADNYKDGYSLASEKEIRRFEDVYDKFITGLYCEGKLSKVYIRLNHDLHLSRLQLAVEPPVFLYIKSDAAGECIFKAAPLTKTNDSRLNAENCFMINAREMALVNDKIELIPEGETRIISSYDNIKIREATDTERKLLLIHAEDALKKERQKEIDKKKSIYDKTSKKIFKSDFKYIDVNRVFYAKQQDNIFIFTYAGVHINAEGNEIIKYNKCLNIYPDFCSFTVSGNKDGSFLTSYSALGILRYANADEINIFEKEHAKWLHQQKEEEQKQTTQTKTEKRDFEPRLRPFISKVLVSNGKDDVWRPAIFGCISESFPRYMIVGGQQYKYCIPYRGNQHLIGKKFNSSDMP